MLKKNAFNIHLKLLPKFCCLVKPLFFNASPPVFFFN